MNSDPVLLSAIADVASIRSWCSANSVTEVPQAGVKYIADNAEVFAFFISSVYDGASRKERSDLESMHQHLDYSAIDDGNRSLAESTLKEAIQQQSGNGLAGVSDDDIVVLHRVLQYAPYIANKPCPIPLKGSPLKLS